MNAIFGTLAALGFIVSLSAPVHAGANLILNGDAESGDLTGWSDSVGRGYAADTLEVFEGSYAFHGGTTGPPGVWSHEILQDVDVSADATDIDAGNVMSTFQASARSNTAGSAADYAGVIVEFRDASGTVIASYNSGDVLPGNTWVPLQDVRTVPAGTRTVRVKLLSRRSVGQSTDGFHDAISLLLTTVSPVEPGSWGRIKSAYR